MFAYACVSIEEIFLISDFRTVRLKIFHFFSYHCPSAFSVVHRRGDWPRACADLQTLSLTSIYSFVFHHHSGSGKTDPTLAGREGPTKKANKFVPTSNRFGTLGTSTHRTSIDRMTGIGVSDTIKEKQHDGKTAVVTCDGVTRVGSKISRGRVPFLRGLFPSYRSFAARVWIGSSAV